MGSRPVELGDIEIVLPAPIIPSQIVIYLTVASAAVRYGCSLCLEWCLSRESPVGRGWGSAPIRAGVGMPGGRCNYRELVGEA